MKFILRPKIRSILKYVHQLRKCNFRLSEDDSRLCQVETVYIVNISDGGCSWVFVEFQRTAAIECERVRRSDVRHNLKLENHQMLSRNNSK